jgi:hypothetical protein
VRDGSEPEINKYCETIEKNRMLMDLMDLMDIMDTMDIMDEIIFCPLGPTKKKPANLAASGRKQKLAATYSPTLLCAVPSASKGLTSEFGMDSGISLSL